MKSRHFDLSLSSKAHIIVTLAGPADVCFKSHVLHSVVYDLFDKQERTLRKLDEECIMALMMNTFGNDLTRLKSLIDNNSMGGGVYHLIHTSLYHLFEGTSKILLRHIKEQAEKVTITPRPRKIFSDIDDTFYRNWVDWRYPPKCLYPGIIAYYAALEIDYADKSIGEVNLVFLSARPDELKVIT